MKNFKTLIIIALLLICFISSGQEEQIQIARVDSIAKNDESIFTKAEGLKTGDIITLKKTPQGYYNYVIMDQERTETLKRGTKLLGFVSDGLSVVGVNTGSIDALEAGRKLGNAAHMAEYGLKANEFFKRKQESREVVIDSLYHENLYGLDEIVADFRIKRKAYKVYLKSALVTDEIEVKKD